MSATIGAEQDSDPDQARAKLLQILQGAYSGELAASIAYQGHAESVRDPAERAEILRIRDDELEHRDRVGAMIARLGGAPDPRRERWLRRVGSLISFLCRIGGWFIPMYGAGRLESSNIREYEEAASYASRCGCEEFVDALLTMAEVEWDHEAYFRSKIATHTLSRVFPRWTPPPPRVTIRQRFADSERIEPVVAPICAS